MKGTGSVKDLKIASPHNTTLPANTFKKLQPTAKLKTVKENPNECQKKKLSEGKYMTSSAYRIYIQILRQMTD